MDSATYSCIIIGSGTLPVQCARILVRSGKHVRSVFAPDEPLTEWAEEHCIPSFTLNDDLIPVLSDDPVDYLFSIVNPRILRSSELILPVRMAVNYHDGPLPHYAGMYATSWALINQEKQHAVTWHEMTGTVDAGAIIRQDWLDIKDDETAFSLNTRCYEVAVSGFEHVVRILEQEDINTRAQQPGHRTYFGRHRRPKVALLLDWEHTPESIAALTRACNFGSRPNPFGVPKLMTSRQILIVGKAVPTDGYSDLSPGSILKIGPEGIKVTTSEGSVLLSDIRSLTGQPIDMSDIARDEEWAVGSRFRCVGREAIEQLDELCSGAITSEPFFLSRLRNRESIQVPCIRQNENPDRTNMEIFEILESTFPVELKCEPSNDPEYRLARVLALFGTYLARRFDRTEIDFSYASEDLRIELQGTPNLFSTLLPLRYELNENDTIDDVVNGIRDELHGFKNHRTFLRDMFDRYPELRRQPTNSEIIIDIFSDNRLDVAPENAVLIISIDLRESRVFWRYRRDTFTRDDVLKMTGHLDVLCCNIGSHPGLPVLNVPLLTAEEKRQILVEWNQTETDYPRDATIQELFDEQVLIRPESPAVRVDGHTYSYGELNMYANRVAHHLRNSVTHVEQSVGLCCKRSLEMIVGLLGILKAGGTYVPVDPEDPSERIAFVLEDCGVQQVLTQKNLVSSLPEGRWQYTAIVCDPEHSESVEDSNLGNLTTATSLAYIIYTSGTTGLPKGVCIEHRGIIRGIRNSDLAEFTPDDSVLQISPVCFDASAFQIWGTLLNGGLLVMAPSEKTSVERLGACIRDNKVTILNMSAGQFHLLVDECLEDLESVRQFVIGGEVVSPEHVMKVMKAFPDACFTDVYGPTECSVSATCHHINSVDTIGLSIPIGRPISNSRAYVLDRYVNPVPVGVPGELVLGGDGVGRKYLNHPALTAKKFIPDPFSPNEGARMYRTGDRCYWQADGSLVFLGRFDKQVKIRGNRIELAGIETTLNRHLQVHRSAVEAIGDSAGSIQLIAYLVCEDGVNDVDIRAYLSNYLPQYMIPSRFVFLDVIPVNANGKIDHDRLPKETDIRSRLCTPYVPPETELESTLVQLWEKLLDISIVGIEDNFLELGGHSLIAMQLLSRIRTAFGIEISIIDIFEYPTIRELAKHIHQQQMVSD